MYQHASRKFVMQNLSSRESRKAAFGLRNYICERGGKDTTVSVEENEHHLSLLFRDEEIIYRWKDGEDNNNATVEIVTGNPLLIQWAELHLMPRINRKEKKLLSYSTSTESE